MNDYQTVMYTQLIDLVKSGDTFYFQDFILDGKIYRIFNYRLSAYTEFLKPSALECRGHTFEVDSNGNATRLVALPMEKFHNLGECPFTQNLDLTKIKSIQYKADGSLISTYMHNGQLRLKSKGSLSSEQAIDSMNWLNLSQNTRFKQLLEEFTISGYTVNLEYVGPTNRIVLGYLEQDLIVLNARNITTGEYCSIQPFESLGHCIQQVNTNGLDLVEFVSSIPSMTESIEGFVVQLESGLRVKIKTDMYCSLHHTKDSINNPRRLFECVLDEGADDLLSMFSTDELAVKQITTMQEIVKNLYNSLVVYVEKFHADNKHLDRKSYAIKGRAEIDPQMYFGLVMNLYLDKSNDYKEFCKKHYKEFGIKDEVTGDSE